MPARTPATRCPIRSMFGCSEFCPFTTYLFLHGEPPGSDSYSELHVSIIELNRSKSLPPIPSETRSVSDFSAPNCGPLLPSGTLCDSVMFDVCAPEQLTSVYEPIFSRPASSFG